MNKKKYLLVVFFAIFMMGGLYAQPGKGTGDNTDPSAPLGGIAVLVISGAVYGMKRLNENKQKNYEKYFHINNWATYF